MLGRGSFGVKKHCRPQAPRVNGADDSREIMFKYVQVMGTTPCYGCTQVLPKSTCNVCTASSWADGIQSSVEVMKQSAHITYGSVSLLRRSENGRKLWPLLEQHPDLVTFQRHRAFKREANLSQHVKQIVLVFRGQCASKKLYVFTKYYANAHRHVENANDKVVRLHFEPRFSYHTGTVKGTGA